MTLRATQQNTEVLTSGTGTLRVTQQNAEVLASGVGTLRATQQNVEILTVAENIEYILSANSVLSVSQLVQLSDFSRFATDSLNTLTSVASYIGPRTVSATSVLVLTDIGRVPVPINTSVISTLSLVQTVGTVGPVTAFAVSVLDLLEFADTRFKNRQISDTTLVLQDAVSVYKVYNALSVLQFEDLAEQGIINQSITHQIQLVSTARAWTRVGLAVSTLALIQTARSSDLTVSAASVLESLTGLVVVNRPYYLQATNPLTYTELVWNEADTQYDSIPQGLLQTVSLATRSDHQAHQYLNWGSQAFVQHIKFNATALAASSTINFTDSLFKNTTGATTSVLQITQSVDEWVGPDSEDLISLVQTAAIQLVRNSLATLTALVLYQSVGYVKNYIGIECNYHPFIGSSDGIGPLPPSSSLPTMPGAIGVNFSYPYESTPTYTWTTARKPEFGNKDQLMFQRINRDTRGGRKFIFADSMWPRDSKMVMTFTALTEVETQAYLTFVQNTLGLEIGLRDWMGRIFRGIITNVQDPMVRNGKVDNSITVEFEITTRAFPLACADTLSLVDSSHQSSIFGRSSVDALTLVSDSEGAL
jgi:hypothetical protein